MIYLYAGGAFAFGFILCFVLIKRRVDFNLTLSNLTHSGYLSNMERHRDFHSVFMGTQAGTRVFKEILSWGHQWESIRSTEPNIIAFKNGERTLAMKIMTATHSEPKSRSK